MKTHQLSPWLQSFFEIRLIKERGVSKHTLRSYSTTFELMFWYAKKRLKKTPEKITLEDICTQFVSEFLNYLEQERNISPRTRNCRLAAIRSFFKYLSPKIPEMNGHIAEVLAIPNKRTYHKLIDYLDEKEVIALLNAPDQKTWLGKRDHAILLIGIETGFRVSELTPLKWENVHFGTRTRTFIKCRGKGRKDRSVPLTHQSENCLKEWKKINRFSSFDFVFPTIHGEQIGPDCVEYLVRKYAKKAEAECLSLKGKKVSPHVLRHTAAMRLLGSGASQAAIALWLGHESIKTTYVYLSADLSMKEEIMRKLAPIQTKSTRYKATNRVIEFLKGQQKRGKKKEKFKKR